MNEIEIKTVEVEEPQQEWVSYTGPIHNIPHTRQEEIEEEQKRRASIPKSKSRPCEACGKKDQTYGDFDPITSTFRGWICTRCAFILGACEDDIKQLQALIKYLQKD